MRIVPKQGHGGCAFEGPGVDLVGVEATREAFAAARPLLEWLAAREPGIVVRSLSVDFVRGRVLATYSPGGAAVRPNAGSGARPHVIRVDPPLSSELLDAAAALATLLAEASRDRLAIRERTPPVQ